MGLVKMTLDELHSEGIKPEDPRFAATIDLALAEHAASKSLAETCFDEAAQPPVNKLAEEWEGNIRCAVMASPINDMRKNAKPTSARRRGHSPAVNGHVPAALTQH